MKKPTYQMTVGEPREFRQFKCPIKLNGKIVRWAVSDDKEECRDKADFLARAEIQKLLNIGVDVAEYVAKEKK